MSKPDRCMIRPRGLHYREGAEKAAFPPGRGEEGRWTRHICHGSKCRGREWLAGNVEPGIREQQFLPAWKAKAAVDVLRSPQATS